MVDEDGSKGRPTGVCYTSVFQSCVMSNCLINAGVLRPGEARVGEDKPSHVVNCDHAVWAALYNNAYPNGMTVDQHRRIQREKLSARRVRPKTENSAQA